MENQTRHFLNINELQLEDLKNIIKKSHLLKKDSSKGRLREKKILAMIFEKPSTRTRVSFEVGMKQLDGDVVILDYADSQLGRGESLLDTIKVLNRYVDLIMYRGSDEKKLYEISEHSKVPIINGLTDESHPCQILADIMTLEEQFNQISDLNICWVGDGNNVCDSWIHACHHFNFNFHISCPKNHFPSNDLIDSVKPSKITLFDDPKKAVFNADVLITDTWISMGMKDKENRLRKFTNFQVNSELISHSKKNTFFLHCLPAHRGVEVTDEVIDSKNSLVWDEAENRLYVHQAILLWCLGNI